MTERISDITATVRAALWDEHLNGYSIPEIARYSWRHFRDEGLREHECSPAEVRKILSDEPPEAILEDLRYIHGVRSFFIAADGAVEETGAKIAGSVFAFQPYRLTVKAFQKGVRAICRDFRERVPGGYVNPQVIEGIDMETALRMLHSGKTVGWRIFEDGSIARYQGEFSPEDENSAKNPKP